MITASYPSFVDFDRVIGTFQTTYENAVGVIILVRLVELKEVLPEKRNYIKSVCILIILILSISVFSAYTKMCIHNKLLSVWRIQKYQCSHVSPNGHRLKKYISCIKIGEYFWYLEVTWLSWVYPERRSWRQLRASCKWQQFPVDKTVRWHLILIVTYVLCICKTSMQYFALLLKFTAFIFFKTVISRVWGELPVFPFLWLGGGVMSSLNRPLESSWNLYIFTKQ